jgi:hypothetical protein
MWCGSPTASGASPFGTPGATPLRQQGYDIRTVPERLGHPQVQTAMVDPSGLKRSKLAVRSLLDERGRSCHWPPALNRDGHGAKGVADH